MATIFTASFGRHRGGVSEQRLLYRAPAIGTSVLRDLVVDNSASDEHNFVFFIQDTGGLAYALFRGKLAGVTGQHLDLRQVLLADDELWVFCDSTSWAAAATGYSFT